MPKFPEPNNRTLYERKCLVKELVDRLRINEEKEKQLIREKIFTLKTSEEYRRDEKEKRNPRIGIHHGEKWNARKWLFLVVLECARLTRSSRLVYAT